MAGFSLYIATHHVLKQDAVRRRKELLANGIRDGRIGFDRPKTTFHDIERRIPYHFIEERYWLSCYLDYLLKYGQDGSIRAYSDVISQCLHRSRSKSRYRQPNEADNLLGRQAQLEQCHRHRKSLYYYNTTLKAAQEYSLAFQKI